MEKLYVFINCNFTCIIAYMPYTDATVSICYPSMRVDVGKGGKGGIAVLTMYSFTAAAAAAAEAQRKRLNHVQQN
jgi:hypothetical protein